MVDVCAGDDVVHDIDVGASGNHIGKRLKFDHDQQPTRFGLQDVEPDQKHVPVRP